MGNSQSDELTSRLRAAIEFHSANNLDAAEAAYREILESDADFVPALHMYGRLCGQRGDLAAADGLLQRALALVPGDEDVLADAAQLRGLQGRGEEAEALIHRALEAAPQRADLHYALAQHLIQRGARQTAIDALERAVSLNPEFANASSDLGAALLEAGRLDPARRALERAVSLDPRQLAARLNLAQYYKRAGDTDAAIKQCQAAIEANPDHDAARRRLANLLQEAGELEAALACRKALAERGPEDAGNWKRMAELGRELDLAEKAIEWYEIALRIEPEQAQTLNDLGTLLATLDRLQPAAECLQSAIDLENDLGFAHQNLAGVYHMQGRHEESVEAFTKALGRISNSETILSQAIAITNYRRRDPDNLRMLCRQFIRALAPERIAALKKCENDCSKNRRLRIGYVSPDFRQHSVGYFIEPIVSGHDRGKFEVFCYSDVKSTDEKTEQFKTAAEHWREIYGEDHFSVANKIREDRIDILVDLNGHCAANRLPVFAQSPAPVQLTYLGYPATTGLPEMTYRLTDEVADPPSEEAGEYTENLIRLPGGFLCYRPSADVPPVADGVGQDGTVTFGSFNEWPKVSPEVVRVWSKILNAVPRSKLLLKARSLGDEGTRRIARDWFQAAGVDPSRLKLMGRTPTLANHLAMYASVDIALDTFPYNGTTTSCEALYMGVPVVTLRGVHHVGRVGASLLSTLGLEKFIADSESHYVETAVALAKNPVALADLRESLRDRLIRSPLMDEPAFVTKLESTYGELWRGWCDAAAQDAGAVSAGGHAADIAGAICVEVADANRIWVPEDWSQLTPYVLLEQEDWFEDEISFVRKYLQPGMRVLDVGANFGAYTLAASRIVGAAGRVWSFEPTPTTFRWLSANIINNGYDNTTAVKLAFSDLDGKALLEVHSNSELNRLVDDQGSSGSGELVEVKRLDAWTEENGVSGIDFVKLDAEGAEKQILHGGRRFFESESPLLMFEIKSGNEQDLGLVNQVKDLGYSIYRLVPGLGVLFPVVESETLDPFTLNLFACNDACREKLNKRSLLGVPRESAREGDAASEEAIWRFFDARPYARGLLPDWRSNLGALDGPSRRLLLQVLGSYVAAYADAGSPAVSVDHLRTAHRACSCSGPASVVTALKHSSVRIALELGWRNAALQALAELVDSNRRDFSGPPGLPFLCASAEFEPVDPGDRFAQWYEASMLDAYVRTRAYSSFFEPRVQADLLTRLRVTGFELPDMQRRRLLVNIRAGDSSGQPTNDLVIRGPQNRNPDLWRLYPWAD